MSLASPYTTDIISLDLRYSNRRLFHSYLCNRRAFGIGIRSRSLVGSGTPKVTAYSFLAKIRSPIATNGASATGGSRLMSIINPIDPTY
jgi:hypothetical protein